MRHRRRTKYFGVKTAHRKAMFRNMATSLFRHGRITTTVTRAKELRRIADKMITLAKEGSLHSRRQVLTFIMDKDVVAKLFSEIAPKMSDRRGGYTRIVRIGPRRGDGAMMCLIELVTESIQVSKERPKKDEGQEQVAPVVIPTASGEESESEDVTESQKVSESEEGAVEETAASDEAAPVATDASEGGETVGESETTEEETVGEQATSATDESSNAVDSSEDVAEKAENKEEGEVASQEDSPEEEKEKKE